MFTTVGPEQEYFLIDEQFYFERPDLRDRPAARCSAPSRPRASELEDHYFGSIPERVLAFMLEVEQRAVPSSACRSRRATTRSRPAQYELAPIFENSNVGSDHQQLTMEIMQNVARRYGLVCLLHEKPFAGVNGSGKHNNWSMGTDTGVNLLEPGDTPHENLQFLFFCAAVIQAVDKHQELLRASVAYAGKDHRLGANEAPPAIISIFLGDELREGLRRDRDRVGRRGDAEACLSSSAPRCCRRCRCTAATATARRRSRSPATSSSSARWARRSRSRCPNTVLNTIVAEAIDELADELEAETRRRRGLEEAVLDGRQGRLRARTSGSSSTATTTPRSGTRRPSSAGCANLRRRPTRCRGCIEPADRRGRSSTTTCCPSASSSRATRWWLEQYVDQDQHRGRDGRRRSPAR